MIKEKKRNPTKQRELGKRGACLGRMGGEGRTERVRREGML
jgi:hypothetical protein